MLAFSRPGGLLCMVNITGQDAALPPHEAVLLTSADLADGKLPPDTAAWLIDADTGRQATRFEHDGPVTTVAFRPDGRAFATGSWDGYARVFPVS